MINSCLYAKRDTLRPNTSRCAENKDSHCNWGQRAAIITEHVYVKCRSYSHSECEKWSNRLLHWPFLYQLKNSSNLMPLIRISSLPELHAITNDYTYFVHLYIRVLFLAMLVHLSLRHIIGPWHSHIHSIKIHSLNPQSFPSWSERC